MSTNVQDAPETAEIECGHCKGSLPLRMSKQGERGAVWLCAGCSVPFVSICIKDRLPSDSQNIKLDDRYFDTDGLPPVSPKLRREVIKMAKRTARTIEDNHRRSERITHSLVVPAVRLNAEFNPIGRSFQVLVSDISREGIGLINNGAIDTAYIALKLSFDDDEEVQVVTKLVRERELQGTMREFGGEFFVRLGSVLEEDGFNY